MKKYLNEFVNAQKRDKVFGEVVSGILGGIMEYGEPGVTRFMIVEALPNNESNILVSLPVFEIEGFTQENMTDDKVGMLSEHVNKILENYVVEVLRVDNHMSNPKDPMVIATLLYYLENNKIVTHEFSDKYIDLYLNTTDANIKGSIIAGNMIRKQQFIEAGGDLKDFKEDDENNFALTQAERDTITNKFNSVLDWLNDPVNDIHNKMFAKNGLDKFKFVQIEFDRGLILEYNANRPANRRITIAKCDIGGITGAAILREVSFIDKPLHEIKTNMSRFSKNALFLGVHTLEDTPASEQSEENK